MNSADTKPFQTVGILGGGQLGRMLTTAAAPLGLRIRIYQTEDTGPAHAAAQVFTGTWEDTERLRAFVEGCDVVTLDNEWAKLEPVLAVCPPGISVWPSPKTMELVRDKVRQKQHAQAQGLPCGPFVACSSAEQLDAAAEQLGFPLVAKRPQHAYDGYGNQTARNRDELHAAYRELAYEGSLLLEQWVPFVRELAVVVARRADGIDAAYPVAHTVQKDHRCVAVHVPAPIEPGVQARALTLARQAAAAYGCVGVVGVELFELDDGTLWLNEIAPRPHNTGHYTIEACHTSQFENHLRAVLGFPLGSTALREPAAVMVNVLGRREGKASLAKLPDALAIDGAHVHVYGKTAVRPGRKMGHVTATGESIEQAQTIAQTAADRLEL